MAFWLVSMYFGVALSLALVTTLTPESVIREIALFWFAVAGFAALAAHRWRPRVARLAHWAIVAFAALYLGTCVELVEFASNYVSFDHAGLRVEYADEFVGVARDQAVIRDLIDQVYSRTGLTVPATPVRVRFISAGSGKPYRFGPGTTDPAGAEIVLSTDRGGLRGSSFPLEASFLITERLAWTEGVSTPQSVANGFAYWTMLGIRPRPDWADRFLAGTIRAPCADLSRVGLGMRPRGELTIWVSPNQESLRLEAAPFIDAERSGGVRAAHDLLVSARRMDPTAWRAVVQQHCAA
jgi:hypothetical protein